jgi:hypothetical protein
MVLRKTGLRGPHQLRTNTEPIASAGSPVQADDDKQPFVTPDGSELWFSSNRAGS